MRGVSSGEQNNLAGDATGLGVAQGLGGAGQRERTGDLRGELDRWSQSRDLPGNTSALALRAITAWSRMHVLVSLEIEGTFASMGIDPDLLFDSEVSALLGPGC